MDERYHGHLLSVTEEPHCVFLPGDRSASGFFRVRPPFEGMKKAREIDSHELKMGGKKLLKKDLFSGFPPGHNGSLSLGTPLAFTASAI